MIGEKPKQPIVRTRQLRATSAGFDNYVEVDRPTVLVPYNDPRIDSQGITGFAASFRSWTPSSDPAPLIPGVRGAVYLYAAGKWLVRVAVTDTPEGVVFYREIEAASWEEAQIILAPSQPQRMVGSVVSPIPTSGQTTLVSCGASIEAVRVEVTLDPALAATTGLWIGCGGQRGVPSTSIFVPKGTVAAPTVVTLEGTRLPIGSIRARAVGANGVAWVLVWSRL